MAEDRTELLRRLFAVLTARLEDAAAIAGEGQDHALSFGERAVLAGRLASATTEIATIAQAVEQLSLDQS